MTSVFPAPSALAPSYPSALEGALWGLALGDALGYPVEKLGREQILAAQGVDSPAGLVGSLGAGELLVSDDTQLTLYTLDGLTEVLEWNNDGQAADELACIWLAYLRWYRGLGRPEPAHAPFSLARPLDSYPAAVTERGPGRATLAALATGEMQFMAKNVNPEALGTGALVRSAPFGFLPVADDATVVKLASHAAALTHGHPEAIVGAAAYALLVRYLLASREVVGCERPLAEAVDMVRSWLGTVEGRAALPGDGSRSLAALDAAVAGAESGVLEGLTGAEWTAPEVLGYAVWVALRAERAVALGADSAEQVLLALAEAVAVDGDSDSLAALVGSLLGARFGVEVFDRALLDRLDAADAVGYLLGQWYRQLGLG